MDETLRVIADAVVDVLEFGAAAVNVVTLEGDLRVDAVAGPAEVRQLLGTRAPLQWWMDLLAGAEPWGELRFFHHERDQSELDRFPSWIPAAPTASGPDAWHPDDSLWAPLWDDQHALVGVLSVDDPRSERLPTLEQRSVLEMFAAQAAKAIRDAQAREAADTARGELEIRWRLAFEQSPTGTALMSVAGRILQANEALAAFLGYPAEELVGLRFADIAHPDDLAADLTLFRDLLAGSRESYEVERRYLRKDASVVYAVLHVGLIRDTHGRVQTIVGQIQDLTERRQRDQQRAHQRTHDALTGVLNHAGIVAELTRRLTAGQGPAVLFCDIDRFKTINNVLGRAVGDQILAAVATRLADTMADEAQAVARVGNDEFVVLAPPSRDSALIHALGERLLDAFRQPLVLADGRKHTVSLSIGAAVSSHEHVDELVADAQEAMQRAKRRGRARVEVYDRERDHPGILEDLQLDQALRAALRTSDQLVVYLQPIVEIARDTVVGSEALVRWKHPQRGLLPPSQFVPVAEHSGLIVDLGWQTLRLGARAAASENEHSGSEAWVAINVSGQQLGRGKLPSAVRDVLVANDLAAPLLHLEFTETALVEATPQAIDEVHEIADMGISIALDDFGTGYSSLSLLRDLPISVVKIDRSFTALVADNRRAAALVRSLVSMCNALDITTIAEGIETHEQLALISALGCDQAQGYLFGVPTPLADDLTPPHGLTTGRRQRPDAPRT